MGAHKLWKFSLGFWHGTNLGPLYISDSCVAWSFMGSLEMGQEPVPNAWAGSRESTPYDGMPCPALTQGRGAWSCFNFICHILLTPIGGLDTSEWRRRRDGLELGKEGRWGGGEEGGKLWLIFKINILKRKIWSVLLGITWTYERPQNLPPEYISFNKTTPVQIKSHFPFCTIFFPNHHVGKHT